MKKYLVYRIEDGLCVNVINWDGISNYDSGDGYALEIIPAGSYAWIGWTRVSEGNWTAPIEETNEQQS